MEGASREKFEVISTLPRDCITLIFSFTSPRDLCSLATLSSVFRSVADLDQLWEQFLPPNYQDILSRATTPVHFSSIKDLFFRLCDPILVDDGQKTIAVGKTNGKVCCMLSAKQVKFGRCEYLSVPESRFVNAAQRLQHTDYFRIQAMLKSAELSINTTYAIYLVYKFNTTTYFDWNERTSKIDFLPMVNVELSQSNSFPNNYNFESNPFLNTINYCCLAPVQDIIHQKACESEEEIECINTDLPSEDRSSVYFPKKRQDGHWMEVLLGEFFNGNGNGEETILVDLNHFDCSRWFEWDTLLLEGIEFRAKIP